MNPLELNRRLLAAHCHKTHQALAGTPQEGGRMRLANKASGLSTPIPDETNHAPARLCRCLGVRPVSVIQTGNLSARWQGSDRGQGSLLPDIHQHSGASPQRLLLLGRQQPRSASDGDKP